MRSNPIPRRGRIGTVSNTEEGFAIGQRNRRRRRRGPLERVPPDARLAYERTSFGTGEVLNDVLRVHRNEIVSLLETARIGATQDDDHDNNDDDDDDQQVQWSAQLVADLHATSCGLCTRPATEVHCFIVSSACLHGACDQCYVRLGDRCSAGAFCETKAMAATATVSPTDYSAGPRAPAPPPPPSPPPPAVALYAFSQATPDNCCAACESAIDGDAILKESLRVITFKRTIRGYPLAVDLVAQPPGRLLAPCRFGPVPLCECCLENQTCTDVAEILRVTPDIAEMTPALRARANIIRGMQVVFMRDIPIPGTTEKVVGMLKDHTGVVGMQCAIGAILGLREDSNEIICIRDTGTVRYLIAATTAATEYVRSVSEISSVTPGGSVGGSDARHRVGMGSGLDCGFMGSLRLRARAGITERGARRCGCGIRAHAGGLCP
jgi:hypothetical protein